MASYGTCLERATISQMSAAPEGYLEVNHTIRIPRRELEVTFSTSGGPGGQHANKAATRVELRFDVETSSALSEPQRQRVIGRLGPMVRIVVDAERSQLRNRSIAEQRLVERLAAAVRVDPQRRATRPTKGSTRRRLEAKKRRSQTKQDRRRPPE
jgi:ribosome-associated protein